MLIKSLISIVAPPPVWRSPVAIALGGFCALGLLTLHLSNASSYLSNDPKACVNCHIMSSHYSTWAHSAHRNTANCNECHVPQDNLLNGLFLKAKDGIRHSVMFTLHLEPQVIRMHQAGQKVVQNNCLRCHQHLYSHLQSIQSLDYHTKLDNPCWSCHRNTPHSQIKSLSSVEYARIPALNPILPVWAEREIIKLLDKGIENENN